MRKKSENTQKERDIEKVRPMRVMAIMNLQRMKSGVWCMHSHGR